MTSQDVPEFSKTRSVDYRHQTQQPRQIDPQSMSALEVEQFIADLRRARDDVRVARAQFNTVTDLLLIDHIVFRLVAAEKRVDYLFQMAKRLGITVDGVNPLWLEED